MTEQLKPQSIPFSFIPGLPLATVALVLFSGLTWPPHHAPRGSWISGWLFLLTALTGLVSLGLYVKKTRHLLSVVEHEPALRTMNALSDHDFFQSINGAFQRMGYTLLFSENTDSRSVRSFRFVRNSQVTLVFLTRKKRLGSKDIRHVMTCLFTEGAERGMIVSTGLYTRGAQRLARTGPVILIDGVASLSLLSRHRSSALLESRLSDPHPVYGEPFLMDASPLCPDCGSDMRLVPAGMERGSSKTSWFCQECATALAYELHS